MNLFKLLFLLLGTLYFLSACEQASTSLVSIPSVSVDCSTSANSRCTSTLSGSSVRIIMSRSGCGNGAEDFDAVASSVSTLVCDSSGCQATLNSWIDSNGNGVSEVITGRMDICGLMDLDSSDTESSGDIVHVGEQDIQSSATITADSWSDV